MPPFEKKLYRGQREMQMNRGYASDPGDFGRGVYWTSDIHRAKAYGKLITQVVKLSNPIYLTVEQAYDLGEQDYGNLVRGETADRLKKAEAMTLDLLAKGYDGLVAKHPDGHLEVVDYRPYRKNAAKKPEYIKTPGFVIEVPKDRRKGFFAVPKAPLVYWAFKNRPRVFINEKLIFTFGGKPVAEALVAKIEGPGKGEDEYKAWHKVYWKPTTFRRFRVAAAPAVAQPRPTDTPQFKKWFGNSKVVDKNGQPLVVYHGTVHDFDVFSLDRPLAWEWQDIKDIGSVGHGEGRSQAIIMFNKNDNQWDLYPDGGKFPTMQAAKDKVEQERPKTDLITLRPGFFFAGNPMYTRDFTKSYDGQGGTDDTGANIKACYLRMENPLDFREARSRRWVRDWLRMHMPKLPHLDAKHVYKVFREGNWAFVEGIQNEVADVQDLSLNLIKDIKSAGFDGYITVEGGHLRFVEQTDEEFDARAKEMYGRGGLDSSMVYVVWSPYQIKSVFNTTFDPKNPSITASKTADHDLDTDSGETYWAGEGNAASGILPVCPQKGTVCLAWRSQYVQSPDCWGTIGGAVQRGKSPQESAKTELEEETGYTGGISLTPAYVFTDGGFTYHNYIGVVGSEFSFSPRKLSQAEHMVLKSKLRPEQYYQLVPGWETDHIQWVKYETVLDDMNENPEDYHPGMLKLFKHSKDAIERALNIKKEEPQEPQEPQDKQAVLGQEPFPKQQFPYPTPPDITRRPCQSGKQKYYDKSTIMRKFRGQGPSGIPPQAYQCPKCGYWHLTRKPQVERQVFSAQMEMFPSSQDAKFRQWFQGSKVVDKNGNPMPVYHGTRSSVDFDTFSVDGPPQAEDSFEGETTSSGSGWDPTAYLGAHFAEETNVASAFAMGEGWQKSRYDGEEVKPRVIQVFLRVTNPKDFGSETNLRNFIYQGKITDDDVLGIGCRVETGYNPWEGDDDPNVQKEIEEYYQKYENDQSFRAKENQYLFEQYRPMDMEDDMLRNAAYDLAMQAVHKLRQSGHDGIRYANEVEGGHAWIVWDPRQIKSVNAQAFDPNDQRFTSSLEDKEADWKRNVLLPAALTLGLGAPSVDPATLTPQQIERQHQEQEKAEHQKQIDKLVEAISRAEGAKPERNNPGNIADFNTGEIKSFDSLEEGKAALEEQLNRIADGVHPFIKPDMTLREAGLIYSNGDPNWAHNVALIMHVPQNTPMKEVIRPRKVSSWLSKAAGFAFRSFKKLWHVGDMNPKSKQPGSLEGNGLSVSIHPEEWMEIAEISGDTWELTKAGNKFLNFHRLSQQQRKQITAWGVQNGYVQEIAIGWRWYYTDENEQERYLEFETEQEAIEEMEGQGEGDVRPAKGSSMKGTDKLKQRTMNPRADDMVVAFDLLVTVYADEELDCDGVWWDDDFDPAGLSAPRGVIFTDKLPTWKARKIQSA
jgi:8-oxo-dGTP pyrophosphatase MutT (NUDIX family)